ncbi:hypothetical protein [Pseudarthrobacter sp. NS4]|uniref:hypothetical protein n=1 Tax=Pseudarthrobacter sp. NS4 TaxID=2973976 RepID=UPI0021632B9C|nr:hypothetical protein [Pseudarthrobacter sp. NS4]
MKRIALLKERQAGNAGTATSTGSHCPVSGLWSPDRDPHTVLSFFEGHVFPAFDGVPTVWRRRSAGAVPAR